MELIKYKSVSLNEMNKLISKSKDATHPYYYRFQYSPKDHVIIANRVRKNLLKYSSLRRNFHQTDVSCFPSYCNSIKKIDKYKNIILGNYGLTK